MEGTDPDKLRALLRGPLHLAVPLRIGDLIIDVRANPAQGGALDVTFKNAGSDAPPVTVWTIP